MQCLDNMKQTLFIISLFLGLQISFAQGKTAFKDGEWFKFRMSYSGFLKAGNATLTVNETSLNGKPVYHVVGKGWTTGAIKWFFKVKDRYESYFDKKTGLPYKFIRQIDEGGHTKDIEIEFDHIKKQAYVENKKSKTKQTFATEKDVQDMVTLNMFFDEENYNFKLKFLGRETIDTEFGKIKTLMFRPYVMAGRVFKEQESLTLWVSADDNKIPLKIKADLEAFKGLKHSFEIQFD